MKSLPEAIFSAAQVRAMDQAAIAGGIATGMQLMTRAAAAALECLLHAWPQARHIGIACGAGNNAGDGYVLARLAMQRLLEAQVTAVVDPAALRGDAAQAHREFVDAGGPVARWPEAGLAGCDVLVDALLGTGLDREVGGTMAAAIAAINDSGLPVLSLDVPSGLDADTGRVRGSTVRASRTMTFVGLKLGLFINEGPACTGALEFDGLGLPAPDLERYPPGLLRLSREWLKGILPRRRRDSHKGEHGHVLIIGGAPTMPGAVCLAGEAALRAGAGRVTVAVHPDSVAAVIAARPELMCVAAEYPAAIDAWLGQVDAIAIGPGLGQDDWARALWTRVLESGRPMVVDADALNLLAAAPLQRAEWILTPHPGEAGRLLGRAAAEVQGDRLAALERLNSRFGGVSVLKGAGTLIGRRGGVPRICDRGNPAMSTAGTGDVLTGIIAAFSGQGLAPEDAAAAGVLVHALAGDRAAAGRQRGLLAGDLFAEIGAAMGQP